MRAGVSLFFAHHGAWAAWQNPDTESATKPDSTFFEEEIVLGNLVEPLGFDSIWGVEHHFSPISMTPNPLQFLTYFAGRTDHIDFGSMVVVLPWHDPVRLAEEIATLDNLLQGRRLKLGLGRGAAQREFDSLRIPMAESRTRFTESLEIIRRALSQETFTFEGEHFVVPETSIRPQARNPDLVDDFLCAWASPTTLEFAAHAGLGMLFVNQKSWEKYQEDVRQFNAVRSTHGWGPTRPTVVAFVSCASSEAEAWDGVYQHALEQQEMVLGHYRFDDAEHFKEAKGYEFYEKIANTFHHVSLSEFTEFFAKPQVWGTPDQCIERLQHIRATTSAADFVLVFRYGGMPIEFAERSMRLFASEVLPELHSWEPAPLPAAAGPVKGG